MNGVIIVDGEVLSLSEAMYRFAEQQRKKKEEEQNESSSH